MQPEHYSICLQGKSVGKSKLTVQLTEEFPVPSNSEEDSYEACITVDKVPCMIKVLDDSGQEEHKALRDQFMRSADGFILVYNSKNKASFEDLVDERKQILRLKDVDSFPMILVEITDNEQERQVPEGAGSIQAMKLNLKFFAYPSSKVQDIFAAVVREIRASKPQPAKSGGCTIS